MDTIRTSVAEGVGRLRLVREAKLNAMNRAFFRELPLAVAELTDDPRIKVILVEAAGRAFSTGLDLVEMAPGSQGAPSLEEIGHLQEGFKALALAPVPTLAAIQGWCLGGGLDLALACDLRIASADAVLSVREVRLGIVADLGALTLLTEVVPHARALELALTGRDVPAEEARAIGLVHEVTSDLATRATELASMIASYDREALMATKALVVRERRQRLATELTRAAEVNARLLARHAEPASSAKAQRSR
jgi:enoyl-CoA hydratase/carnithine racemase